MRYLSVCSGIEAATVAWHHMGWQPVAFSEIEPFPSAVLKHHYPNVPNVGDMTKFKEWNLEPIDLLVGGTPCQSFSVAGLRKGLDDPRGNLMLTFLAIAERERPKWIVWENVPGVLSSNGGRDFGTFLAALGELGYGWAFRVLDAQWFGVAQRRRRVFVVASLGDQAGAAAVLFESESVQRNPAPSREKGQGVARGVARCFAGSSESRVAATLETTSHDYSRADGFNMVAQPVAFHPTQDPISSVDVCHALSGGSKQGNASAAVAQPVALGTDCYNGAITGEVAATLGTGSGTIVAAGPSVMQAVGSFKPGQSAAARSIGYEAEVAPALEGGGGGNNKPAVHVAMQVRRLTPTECERLQGFPDGYTNIAWRKKDEAPDGPRYKALGNSMAVPCMRWIGERIQAATARQEVQP